LSSLKASCIGIWPGCSAAAAEQIAGAVGMGQRRVAGPDLQIAGIGRGFRKRQRETHKLRLHCVERGGFGVEGDDAGSRAMAHQALS
jgi:hypothetical protein